MRYWAYFAAKFVIAGATLYGLLLAVSRLVPTHPSRFAYIPPRFGYDLGYTLAVLGWFLVSSAACYVIIWDQRYRCRVCLRRLRMPVETGSWSSMLQLGLPKIEYICPYGHGTLKEDEFQISGTNAEWTPHSDDIWEELCAASKDPGEPS
ncbi:MAG TPA: hypothetical protein VKU19_41605 [Bryobacteraceae bacterium]|nr:hypothetical protein [Bryobacteraceae bacterium]